MATGSNQQISVPDDPGTVVEIGGRYYILATGITADENDRVLKHAQSFAIFDRFGDIKPVGLGEEWHAPPVGSAPPHRRRATSAVGLHGTP